MSNYLSLILWHFPGGSDSKESVSNVGDLGLIPGSGRYPGEGKGYLLQYSCLGNSMDRRAWQTTVHGVVESDMTEWLTLSLLLYFSSKRYQIHWITIDFPFVRTIKEVHRWKLSNTVLFIWRRYRLCFTHYMIFSTWRSQSMNSVFKHDRIHIYAESGATYMQKHKSVHLTPVFEKCYSVMSYSLWPHGL